jgi:hypothetical protein
MERKARQYIDMSDGKIRVAVIVDLEYPDMKKGWISLLAADDSDSARHWVQHSELFHDDDLAQPVGQVEFYLSDFVGLAGVPAAFCRPSAAEVAAGVSRFVFFFRSQGISLTCNRKPQIILPYERLAAIFRVARSVHGPTKFHIKDGDKEENPYERLVEVRNEVHTKTERRLAEIRIETERRVAEIRNEWRRKTDRRIAEMRAEFERRMAQTPGGGRVALAEYDRRIAEIRAEFERRTADRRLEEVD